MKKQTGDKGWEGKPATFGPATGRKDTAAIDKAAAAAALDAYDGPIDESKLTALGARTLAGYQARYGIAAGNLKFQSALEKGLLGDNHIKSNAVGTPKTTARPAPGR